MTQPARSATSATEATETVTRPDPGLARGKWEAPGWALWVILAVVVVGAGAYVLARMGILRLPSKAAAPARTSHPPPRSPRASRVSRPPRAPGPSA